MTDVAPYDTKLVVEVLPVSIICIGLAQESRASVKKLDADVRISLTNGDGGQSEKSRQGKPSVHTTRLQNVCVNPV